MTNRRRILVIGPAMLADYVRRALPDREVCVETQALGGVWQAGRSEFGEVLLSLSLGERALRAVRSLRQVAPEARIVLTCAAGNEPRARQALDEGADDYLIEPLRDEDFKQMFRQQGRTISRPSNNGHGPTHAEIIELSDVLQKLGDGPRPTLERLAALVRHALDATGVAIRLDELRASIGDDTEAVLEEPILRQGQAVGAVRVNRRARGTYSASSAARLADLGRLIEATVAQAAKHSSLRTLAWTDDLSQLHNRRYFEERLDELLARAAADQSRVTVLFFDIDDFKGYNDAYGHDVGDDLIREVAVLLKRCSRADDVVARYGGDEFAIIFWDAEQPRVPGSEHPHDPMALAERFQQAIREHSFQCLGPDAPGPVTLTGGLACYPTHGRTRAALLRAADQVLLATKRAGKNRIGLAGEPSAETQQPTR
ncbi:MAG: diguanylate cyclase [Phycisphaerae bacterium]|nr:diguanylate cyclase [Phycisphaerae bacterium]